MFRLAEQNGIQAAAVDVEYSTDTLYEYPVAVLPGCAVIEENAAKAIMDYVAAGNVLILTGGVPVIYQSGEKCTLFEGLQKEKIPSERAK